MDLFLLQHCIYCHNKGVIVQCQAATVGKCGSTESRFILSLFLLFFFFLLLLFLCRDLSESNKEQRCGDSAIVAGDGWRVHYCQLLGQAPGTTPPQHTPTHTETTVLKMLRLCKQSSVVVWLIHWTALLKLYIDCMKFNSIIFHSIIEIPPSE